VNGQSLWQDRVNHYVAIRELGKESRKNYKYILHGFLRWAESERPGSTEVTAQELAGYFDALRLRGRKPVTVSYHLQILRGFFAWLVGEGHISVDPTADFSTLRQTPLARDTLTIEEMSALWRVAEDPFDRSIVGLLGINALRPDEISRALVSDLGHLDQRKILRLPSRSGIHSSLPYTVLDDSLHEAIVDQMKGRRSGPLLLRRGAGVSRKAQAIIVARLGKAAQIPIAITPSTLTFSMRAIAIEKGFSYLGVVRSAGDMETRRLAQWVRRAPNPTADHAALRMARLVVGTGRTSEDLLVQARVLLQESDSPSGVAASFAGAVLERHLRFLTEEHGLNVKTSNPKLGSYASVLSARRILSPSDVQLIARIQGFRDDAAHGWFDRVTAKNAEWVINEVGHLLQTFPLGRKTNSGSEAFEDRDK
jgi:integrase